MGQTAKFNLPYPELTDTPDVPRDMKALADAVEGALGGGGEGRPNTTTILKENLTIGSSAWTSDSTFPDYPFKADITVEGLTAEYLCYIFTPDHTDRGLDGFFSPFVLTGEGKFTVFGASNYSKQITIENVAFEKVVG